MSKFEIVTTTAGALSIRNNVVNEIMHNPVGPWAEANALYIEPSQLAKRLNSPGPELVIFDVGLGAAANALAALHCARGKARTMRLVSFELDLELLQFALENSIQFEHFRGFEGAIGTLLKDGIWSDGTITWELRHGDFLELIESETQIADLVFFDPYSHKVNLEMWTVHAFQKLRRKCSENGALLFTYSRATPIRAALLHAGFFAGHGPATGLKDETTQASTRLEDLANPLGLEWLEKFKRSHKQLPLGASEGDSARLHNSILNHPQFENLLL